jgi:hypothetical protein
MKYEKLILILFFAHFSSLAQDTKRVLFPFEFYEKSGFMNAAGEIIVQPIYEEADMFYDGLAKVRLNGYFGFIDATGKLVIPNIYEMVERFHNGVAIVYKNGKPFCINTKGNIIDKEPIPHWVSSSTEDTYDQKEFKYLDKYGDLKEKYEAKFEHIDYDKIYEFGEYLVYTNNEFDCDSFVEKYGIANLEKGFATQTWYRGIDLETLTDDLIYMGNYVNQQGKIVAIERRPLEMERFLASGKVSSDDILSQYNISYQRRTNYKVGCIGNLPELRSFGGWQPSENVLKKITSLYNFKPNALSVIVDDERNETYDDIYEGYTFYISNNTKDSIFFDAYDSTIDVVLEAKNQDDQWKAIEYQTKNLKHEKYIFHFLDEHAFHQLYLPAKTYWELNIPKFYGVFKTKLRVKLQYRKQPKSQIQIMYSNEFDGSVNPAQFWYRKRKTKNMKPKLGN